MPRVANPETALVVLAVRVPKRAVEGVDRFAMLRGVSRTQAARMLLMRALEEVPRGE